MADTTETRWKLVKVEADADMRGAMCRAECGNGFCEQRGECLNLMGRRATYAPIWAAAIAASPPPGEEVVRPAVDAILADLSDRRGIRDALDDIDDDVMGEIRQSLARAIIAAMGGTDGR